MLVSAFLACPLRAQAPPPEPPPASPQSAPQQLSQEELKNIVGPIALYPDALIALILPASTVPSDLVLAERYIASNGDPAQVANQPCHRMKVLYEKELPKCFASFVMA